METFVIEQDLEFQAPVKKVFDALTKDINKWWDSEHSIGGEKTKKFVCEPKLGGKFYEIWGEGEGSVWGTVTEVKKNVRLEICGTMGAMGATWCKMGYDLEPNGKSTRVKFTHHGMGTFDEDVASNYREGWTSLFGMLKEYVEKSKKK